MNDPSNTILILTPGFARNEADTACLPFQQAFLRSFRQQFPAQKTIILSFQYPYEESSYQWHGITVISMGGKNKGGLRRRLLWWKVWRRLKKLAKENNISHVLSFWCGECTLMAKRFAVANHIPWYCWIPGQDAKKENRYVKHIDPPASALVAVSDFIASEFERNHGIRPVHIIPPGIEESQQPLPLKDIDILGAGSLIPLKQFSVFVEMVFEIKKKLPGIRAVLAGDGPEKDKIEQLIKLKSLEQNITLTGEIPHQQVLALMERSRLFLHPSSYEGFGIVSIEALYAGNQVISFVRPMNVDIPHWHIVPDKQAMLEKAISVLQSGNIPERIIFRRSVDTAKEFARLFNI